MKRDLLLPFILLLAIGIGLVWLADKTVSRVAIFQAADRLLLESASRIKDRTIAYLDEAVDLAVINAALVDPSDTSPTRAENLRMALWRQLNAMPAIDIVSIGFSTGEYVEAQRLDPATVRTGRSSASTGGDLVLERTDADGRPVEEMLRRKAYDPRQRPWYLSAARAGRPAWSEPYAIVSSRELVMSATVPVLVKGVLAAVSTADIGLGRLNAFLAEVSSVPGASASIVDGAGHLISVSNEALIWPSGTLTPLVHDLGGLNEAAFESTRRTSSQALHFSFESEEYRAVRLPLGGKAPLPWDLIVVFPEASFYSFIGESDRLSLLVLAASLFLALGFGFFAARRVSEPLRQLGLAFSALDPENASDSGEMASLMKRVDEVGKVALSYDVLIRRLAESFASLKASIAEKEILLKELNHRVKNNLQIVSSLISTQAASAPDHATQEGLYRLQERIQAMAYVHEDIYHSNNIDSVDMGRYLRRICESLASGRTAVDGSCLSSPCDLEVKVEADAVFLDLDQSIPCGLIVNELVANCIKHAFAGRDKGMIRVGLTEEALGTEASSTAAATRLVLVVEDDGVGMRLAVSGRSDPRNREGPGGIGSLIVEALASQLGGKLETKTGSGGTSFALSFPARLRPSSRAGATDRR